MTTPSPPPRKTVNHSSILSNVFETVVLVGNVCGNSPFPFPIVALSACGGSYLIYLCKDDSPSTLLSGLALIILYYAILGIYRIFVFNRYLDPLLAIPGPKVSLPWCALTVGTLAQRSPSNHPRLRGLPFLMPT